MDNNEKNMFTEKDIKPLFDIVNKPEHYNSGNIEVIDYIEDVTSQIKDGFIGACVANILKYSSRFHKKNGAEDIKKAVWYANKCVEYMNKIDWTNKNV